MSKLEAALQQWGLNTGDLLFGRVPLSPDPDEAGGTIDLEGYHNG